MAWSTPATWVAGAVLTAAQLNAQLRDNLNAAFSLGVDAWTSYVPTFLNTTVGNGTVTGSYARVGRTIYFKARLVWGSTTAFTGLVDVSLPVAILTSGVGFASVQHAVPVWLVDSSARHFIGLGILGVDAGGTANSGRCKLLHTEAGSGGAVDATNPFTWATTDVVLVSGCYEAAS